MRLQKKQILILSVIIFFISIGFAYLTANLNINGISLIKKNTWDVHFDNLVDDTAKSEVNFPATISDNKKSVNFEVTLSKPGDNYYFYVDVVNAGTIDAMLDSYEIIGLTEAQKKYLEWDVTYSDGVALTKHDILKSNSKEILKVCVSFIEDVNIEDLPKIEENAQLTFKSIYVQADQSANDIVHIEDKEGPVVRVGTSKNTTEGNNSWYKNILLNTKLIDYNGIKSTKYCITKDERCSPNTEVELKNNSFEVLLENSRDPWTICVESKDNLDNTENYCDRNKYYVDGEDPKVSSIEVEPADLAMEVNVEATDAISGVAKYYYSKDGGKTYVVSTNSNYTFTKLEAKDYIVMAYVEDVAGNKSTTVTETTTVREYSWCEKNKITKLGDCAIATEAHNPNIEEAKQSIKSKPNPDFSKTSPTYTYKEKHSSTLTTKSTNNSTFKLSTNYNFNKETGQYSLINPEIIDLSEINFSDNTYYSCLSISADICTTLYKIQSVDKQDSNSTYNVKKYDYMYDVESYDEKGIGMYASEDEDSTTSYYYRGSVGGNYVKFANMYWRIIRINGDGSIRLMYFSDTDTINGKNAFNSKFNENYWDPTYVGLMHNDKAFSETEIVSNNVGFNNFDENRKYFFGKNYEWDESAKSFKLTGADIMSGVWKEKYNDIINGGYIYSCFGTSATETCPVIMKIHSYVNVITARVQYISHSSTSYDNATRNEIKSNLLITLESWYENNILNINDDSGNSYNEYVENSTFCNDRSIISGDGFSLNVESKYSSVDRLSQKYIPSYKCPNLVRDGFTINNSNAGNELLKYPVGILTADEVAFAGGVNDINNLLYFINYKDNMSIWTLSPARIHSWARGAATVVKISETGSIIIGGNWVSVSNGVRPVISLNKDILISGGDGTANNPYTVKLK